MTWLWKLTGGRPMTYVSSLFSDRVTGKQVCHYRDRLGNNWLACGSWDWFRVGRTTAHVIDGAK